MIWYAHVRERAFKRMSFFLMVFAFLFDEGNPINPIIGTLPILLYYRYLHRSAENSEISFSENNIEYRTDLKKWRGVHNRILLFMSIVGLAEMIRIIYPDDETLLIVRTVVILITALMIFWIDISLTQIFKRERDYIWDFVLLSALVANFLGLTLTDQFSYFILLWNVFLELAVFLFYWGFKRQLMIMARYPSEND